MSTMEMDAVREPVALGVNVTLMVQFAPVARVAPHEFVNAKFEAFVPVREMLVIVILAVPLLVNVTVLGLLVVLSR